jgi:hypothetical protein
MALRSEQTRSRTVAAPGSNIPSEDEIRTRAYELYEERGREDGHPLDDWLRPEEEIARNKVRLHVA